MLVAVAALSAGAAVVALFVPRWGITTAVALTCVFMVCNGASRPPLFALLGGVPPQARATVLGLNISCASVRWMCSALLGGLLVAAEAWATMGWLAAGLSLAGAALVWMGRAQPLR